MQRAARLSTIGKFLPIVAIVMCGFSVLPTPVKAQSICSGAAGNNAVWGTCTGSGFEIVRSTDLIDASPFGRNNTNICAVLNGILSSASIQYPASGAVIDARGLPGNTGTNMTCTISPWGSGSGYINVPSTILLPAGTITIPSSPGTWILPNGTKLIGEGTATNGTGTTILAGSNFTTGTPMIQLGDSHCPSPGCTGISVENLTLNGAAQNINGIQNQNSQDLSYVDRVNLYQILGTGLLVGSSTPGNANNSGPYSNITFNVGSTSLTATACAQINGLSGTRGIHGLNCTSPTNDSNAAVLLDSSNNSIEDVTIGGFYNGIVVGSMGPARSNVLVNISDNTKACSSNCPPTPVNMVHIEPYITSGTPNVSDLSIIGASNDGAGTVTILDDLTSTNLNDTYVSIYALGQSKNNGYSRFTTSPNAATWVVGTTSPSNASACPNGSLYSCTGSTANCMNGSSSAALWACVSSGNAFQWVAVK
jgi:hypothetical protein